MFLKVLIIAFILCTFQSHQVHSFEVLHDIKNFVHGKITKVVHKVHNIIHPNHRHTESCNHLHSEEHVVDLPTTTPFPQIDIRFDNEEGKSMPPDISKTLAAITTEKIELPPLESDVVPNINSRNIIDAPCVNGMRQFRGECREVIN